MSHRAYFDEFLREKNAMARLFGARELEVPGSFGEAIELLDMIECDLSPENLTCDGELSAQDVLNKQRVLNGARNHVLRLMEEMGGIYA